MSFYSAQQSMGPSETITMYQVTKTEITLNPLYQENRPFISPRTYSNPLNPGSTHELNRQFVFPNPLNVSEPEILPAVITAGQMEFETKPDTGRRFSLPNLRSIYPRKSSSSSVRTSKSEPILPSSSRRNSLANLFSRHSRNSSITSAKSTQSEPVLSTTQLNQELSIQGFFDTERDEQRRKSAPDVLTGQNLRDSKPNRTLGEWAAVSQRLRFLRIRAHKRKLEEMENAKPLWTEKYDLDLPLHVTRDKSELDFLRRRNELAVDGVLEIDADEEDLEARPVFTLLVTRPSHGVSRHIISKSDVGSERCPESCPMS